MIATRTAPSVPLTALDQLWFQVSGTVCNLRCSHCFISCSPDNHSFWFMTRAEVRSALEESTAVQCEGVLLHRRRALHEPRDGGDPG